MKNSILNLVIAGGLTLPVVSFADSYTLSDFERDYINGQTRVVAATTTKAKFDPWNYLVNVAREYHEGSDATLASFERDFARGEAEVTATATAKSEIDPWSYVANVTHQYGEDGDAIWASFERSFLNGQAGTVIKAERATNNSFWTAISQYEWNQLINGADLGAKS